jgi:hypothetical protein
MRWIIEDEIHCSKYLNEVKYFRFLLFPLVALGLDPRAQSLALDRQILSSPSFPFFLPSFFFLPSSLLSFPSSSLSFSVLEFN